MYRHKILVKISKIEARKLGKPKRRKNIKSELFIFHPNTKPTLCTSHSFDINSFQLVNVVTDGEGRRIIKGSFFEKPGNFIRKSMPQKVVLEDDCLFINYHVFTCM